jgi:hypothetical protein
MFMEPTSVAAPVDGFMVYRLETVVDPRLVQP